LSAVSSELFIYVGRAVNNGEEATLDKDGFPVDRPSDGGDVAAHGFWRRGHTALFDIHITDTDASSYLASSPSKVLVNQEKAKKQKYFKPCLQHQRHFRPLCHWSSLPTDFAVRRELQQPSSSPSSWPANGGAHTDRRVS
jgi:hypothetical protein